MHIRKLLHGTVDSIDAACKHTQASHSTYYNNWCIFVVQWGDAQLFFGGAQSRETRFWGPVCNLPRRKKRSSSSRRRRSSSSRSSRSSRSRRSSSSRSGSSRDNDLNAVFPSCFDIKSVAPDLYQDYHMCAVCAGVPFTWGVTSHICSVTMRGCDFTRQGVTWHDDQVASPLHSTMCCFSVGQSLDPKPHKCGRVCGLVWPIKWMCFYVF